MNPSSLPPAVLLALGLSAGALADDDTGDTGPCLSPIEDSEVPDTGPCLTAPRDPLCGGKGAAALALPLLLSGLRRRSRSEVLERLRADGVLPGDLAGELDDEG